MHQSPLAGSFFTFAMVFVTIGTSKVSVVSSSQPVVTVLTLRFIVLREAIRILAGVPRSYQTRKKQHVLSGRQVLLELLFHASIARSLALHGHPNSIHGCHFPAVPGPYKSNQTGPVSFLRAVTTLSLRSHKCRPLETTPHQWLSLFEVPHLAQSLVWWDSSFCRQTLLFETATTIHWPGLADRLFSNPARIH